MRIAWPLALALALGANGSTLAQAAATRGTDANVVRGEFALAGIAARSTATLRFARVGERTARLDIAFRASGRPVRDFDIEMTKRMHLIVVDRGLQSFAHLHPALAANGHFYFTLHVARAGRYLVYADVVPHGIAQQVFRFPIDFGRSAVARTKPSNAIAPASGAVARSGPYTVALDRLTVGAGRETHVGVTISNARDGRLATDLRPYLGGAAHAVLIDTRTLDYLHVHPVAATQAGSADDAMTSDTGGMGAMPGMTAAPLADDAHVAPKLALHLVAPQPGTYKLWLQFRGADGLHVAPFTLVAR